MDNLRRFIYYDLLRNFEPFQQHDYHPRRFHIATNPFEELTGEEFVKVYRLTKERVTQLIDVVRQFEAVPARRSALGAATKVLTAIRFFATGSYQLDIGLGRYSSISQPSVSRSIHSVINALNRDEVFGEYVKFYENIEEVRASRNRFYEKFGFPHAIGCIDCTHVAIVPPEENHPVYPERAYVNRKGYHSLNVQLVCDADMKILNVNARHPGSNHDTFIWNNSNLEPLMRRIHNQDDEHYFLLGDSGYPLRSWLMTPFIDPLEDSPEANYNTVFCRARSLIECVNGLLKMRFRCLLKHRVLHYSPTVAGQIVNSCVILHNMAIMDNFQFHGQIDPIWEDNAEFGMFNNPEDELPDPLGRINPELAAGRLLRQRIVNQWFL